MIHIYQADSLLVRQKKNLKELLLDLPGSMHERALRYQFERDAFNFVVGRLLLKQGLDKLKAGLQIENISFKPDGKPWLAGIHFNIAHSENLVVCALSELGAIGIDVEKIKPVDLDNFKPWFTLREWDDINQAADPLRKFYWYWTRKESIIKALGMKLAELNKVEIDPKEDTFIELGEQYFLKDLNFGADFSAALCSEIAVHAIEFISSEDF